MTLIDTLTQRNADFAAQEFTPSASLAPTLRTLVIGCVDPRIDPAHLLSLELGEAAVIRNVGGRVDPATRRNLALLATLGKALARAGGGDAPAPLHIVVLHHTDCGITRLVGETDMLAAFVGIGTAELAAKAIADPWQAVAVDVAALKVDPALPGAWTVSGLVYDVTTGLITVVVPPAPLRDAGRAA